MSIQNVKNAKQNDKKKLIISILKILLLLTIVIGIPLYIWFFHGDFIKSFKSIDDVVNFLNNYKNESVIAYIVFQIVQIVISVIPGQVFPMAASYLYGFFPAWLYTIIGTTLGTAITYGLAKLLGRDFLHIFFGEEKVSHYIHRLNTKGAYIVVFFIYLIPGIPKDMVSYVAGVSEVKFKPFLILSLIGRLPGMIGCMLMGLMLDEKNYIGFIVLGVVAIILCSLCFIYKKPIQRFLDRAYNKLVK